MKSLSLAIAGALAATLVTSAAVEAQASCPPKPAPVTSVIFDPDAVKYAGPYCAEGETCTPFVDNQPGIEVRPDGVAYTFTHLGELRPAGQFVEQSELKNLGPPQCWQWVFQRVVPIRVEDIP